LYSKSSKSHFEYLHTKCDNHTIDGDLYIDESEALNKSLIGAIDYERIESLFCGIPKFSNFNTIEKYKQSNKPLIQKGFARTYRTRLKKVLKEKKPEFSGKYIIAQWGCDEGKYECTTGGIIDASTGKATEFPFKYYAHNGSKEIIYKVDSSLLIVAGDFEFKDGKKEENKVLFYEFNNGKFLLLKSTRYH
jgi:hypothetical protein